MISKKIKKRPISNNGGRIKGHESTETKPAKSKKPIFCFQYLDKEYCISKCDKRQKAALADQIRKLSELTWSQIHQAGRHQLGYEKISKNALRRPLPPHIEKDESIKFIAFRFCGKAPMVGYCENEIFHVIWLDAKYDLYDHGS